MPPALPLPGPPAGESFLSRDTRMPRYHRQPDSSPMSWLHVIGFVLVLWAVASDAMAQARDMIVTEVRGGAVRVSGAPVKPLDTMKAGERFRLAADSRVGIFSAQEAQLYVVEGPGEVAIGPQGVAANGRAVAGRKLDEAYRNIKPRPGDLVQGSLVMRSARSLRLVSPEGAVPSSAARAFSWTGEALPWRFELGTDEGEPVYSATTAGNRLELPPSIELKPGVKYVWGLRAASAGASPVDWTEFIVRDGAAPPEGASASERVVHALWLQSQSLPRAAARAMEEPAPRN